MKPLPPMFVGIGALLGAMSLTACDAPTDQAVDPAVEAVSGATWTTGAREGVPKRMEAWWPERLDLSPLRANAVHAGPYPDFDYAAEFEALDLVAVKADIAEVMTRSQDWWPADYGNYGPFFIRLAWHSAGTYRMADGRGGADGGQIRFEPLNSWPDNTNLDKARRLLMPVKEKYGRALSWSDLMVLSGTVAMEEMGVETVGFAGGRVDDWEPELVYWGPEGEMLADARYEGDRELDRPLAAVQMGLIYVNPEGPNGEPDPLKAAADIRDTFARMAMNDEETVALIAGGHTFGKAHGAHAPADCVGEKPAAGDVEAQGIGWQNRCGTGNGADTVTSGLEGAWTSTPAQWSPQYFANLMGFDWEQTESPAGATQWQPKDGGGLGLVPDAHDPDKRHAPMMFTTDLSLKADPAYREISERFLADPEAFERAFAEAWFKLTHRDLGPRSRYAGSDVPEEAFLWQDPVPQVDHPLVDDGDIAALKAQVLGTELSNAALVRSAWSAAASYRASDMRGGVNGARVRLEPQLSWDVNDREELERVLTVLEEIRGNFNARAPGGKQVSLADMLVIGGAAGIERAAEQGGLSVQVPVAPGRTDASAAQTDAASFAVLEPKADGFRNFYSPDYASATGYPHTPASALVDQSDMLELTVSEMAVLIGGLRVLDANAAGAQHGVLTDAPGTLSHDFFLNLLDLSTEWQPSAGDAAVFEGRDRDTGAVRWTATEVDLVFGSNAELRAVAEVYASPQNAARFAEDFVAAWTKVMRLDRFDLDERR